jgi:nucleotide-binding universal stress UspA family protein
MTAVLDDAGVCDLRPLTLRCVLAATDLSEGSAAAIQTASALARLTDARLVVLHAVSGRDEQTQADVASWLSATIPADRQPDHVHVVVAEAADVIAEHATSVGADVIVLGPHREPERTGRLGSTADRVVRSTQTPCLVVPRPMALPLGRVLVPIDLTDAARGALLVGLSWASALRRPTRQAPAEATQLDVLHVSRDARDRASAQASLHEQVKRVHARLSDAPGVHIRERVEESGDPATAILERVSAGEVDLAVLGTHGHSTLQREILGSVSSAVVRQSRAPVLLVPPVVWREHAREAA